MSLAKAMLLLADIIDKDADKIDLKDRNVWAILRSYAGSIRIAVAAAEDAKVNLDVTLPRQQDGRLKKLAEKEERNDASMAQIVGGNSDGDFVQIDPTMPVGAKMLVAGQVVVLKEDGKLHVSDIETKKLKAKLNPEAARQLEVEWEKLDQNAGLRPFVDSNHGIVIP